MAHKHIPVVLATFVPPISRPKPVREPENENYLDKAHAHSIEDESWSLMRQQNSIYARHIFNDTEDRPDND